MNTLSVARIVVYAVLVIASLVLVIMFVAWPHIITGIRNTADSKKCYTVTKTMGIVFSSVILTLSSVDFASSVYKTMKSSKKRDFFL